MRKHSEFNKTTESRKAIIAVTATALLSLFVVVSTGFAEQADQASSHGWSNSPSAQQLGAVQPATANPEDVEMLRRLLGLSAPAAPVSAPQPGSSASQEEEMTPVGDSASGPNGSVSGTDPRGSDRAI